MREWREKKDSFFSYLAKTEFLRCSSCSSSNNWFLLRSPTGETIGCSAKSEEEGRSLTSGLIIAYTRRRNVNRSFVHSSRHSPEVNRWRHSNSVWSGVISHRGFDPTHRRSSAACCSFPRTERILDRSDERLSRHLRRRKWSKPRRRHLLSVDIDISVEELPGRDSVNLLLPRMDRRCQ